jgi:ribose 5-phosphate isomerase B
VETLKKLSVVIAADHGGFNLKNNLLEYVKSLGYSIEDYGTCNTNSCDYPDFAFKVAEAIKDKKYDRGILVCGSGLGMAISANKLKGIRAVTCTDSYCAKMSVLHNNANILTLGERVIGVSIAQEIVKVWLESEFEGGRHQKRLDKIDSYNG